MSFVIGTVTLPLIPTRVLENNPASLKTGDNPGKLPIIFSIGKKERKLTVEGYIYVDGQTKAQLQSNYLEPLRNLVYTIVVVTSPDSRYNGSYILEDFTFEETNEYPSAYKYKILLTQGDTSNMFVLSAS